MSIEIKSDILAKELNQGIVPLGVPKAYQYDAALVEAARAAVNQGIDDVAEAGDTAVNSVKAQESTSTTNINTLGDKILAQMKHGYGYPFTAANAAAMTDTAKIYVYTGSETGYTNGNWYYWNGTAWVSGGVYNATALETSISLPSYILLGNDYVKFQNYYISKDYLTTKLTNASVSDTIITMRLGMACNKNVGNAGGKIPFIFEGSYSNDGNMWYGKKGDFLGDSLTEQHQYTDALEDLYNITVNNYGKSGTTISNINSTDMFKDRISNMSLDCDFIFVLGGTNDWGLGVPLGTKTLVDNDYSTFYNALYNTLSALRNRFPLKPIFVATIPVRNWQGGGQASGIWQNSQGNSLMEFNDAICYVANIIGATVIDSFSSGINLESLSTYTNDNLHFNEAGGKRFATYVMDCMKRITPY